MYQYATESPAAREPLLATLLPKHMNLSLPGEATEEAVFVFLLDNLAVDNSEVLELTRGDSSGVQHLNVGVRPVLCLRFWEMMLATTMISTISEPLTEEPRVFSIMAAAFLSVCNPLVAAMS
jgi:hypothetical protein